MATIDYGWAGPQHPIYGLHYANIATRLTRLNWRTKAIVRCGWDGWIYLWVARGTYQCGTCKVSAYFIKTLTGRQESSAEQFEQEFTYLVDALACANGEDGGLLATQTWPAEPGLYPLECEAPYVIGHTSVARRSR